MEYNITLISGRDLVDLKVDGLTVRITAERDGNGSFIDLGGMDCHLEGEMPGQYYLRPMESRADA